MIQEIDNEIVEWTPDIMVEVRLHTAEDFLKIRETLSRMGVASRNTKTLYQSCHILHRKERYYICHFKELFALDGKPHNLSVKDLQRRNTIAHLLKEWDLLDILDESQIANQCPIFQIKILRYSEIQSGEWTLTSKYNLGKYKRTA